MSQYISYIPKSGVPKSVKKNANPNEPPFIIVAFITLRNLDVT